MAQAELRVQEMPQMACPVRSLDRGSLMALTIILTACFTFQIITFILTTLSTQGY